MLEIVDKIFLGFNPFAIRKYSNRKPENNPKIFRSKKRLKSEDASGRFFSLAFFAFVFCRFFPFVSVLCSLFSLVFCLVFLFFSVVVSSLFSLFSSIMKEESELAQKLPPQMLQILAVCPHFLSNILQKIFQRKFQKIFPLKPGKIQKLPPDASKF